MRYFWRMKNYFKKIILKVFLFSLCLLLDRFIRFTKNILTFQIYYRYNFWSFFFWLTFLFTQPLLDIICLYVFSRAKNMCWELKKTQVWLCSAQLVLYFHSWMSGLKNITQFTNINSFIPPKLKNENNYFCKGKLQR